MRLEGGKQACLTQNVCMIADDLTRQSLCESSLSHGIKFTLDFAAYVLVPSDMNLSACSVVSSYVQIGFEYEFSSDVQKSIVVK